MAKTNKQPTKANVEMETSTETLSVEKPNKKDKKEVVSDKKVAQKKTKNLKQKSDKPKRNRTKEVISELKKVNWPTFKQALKQTGAVLAVVSIFMLAILGIDTLVSWILDLILKI